MKTTTRIALATIALFSSSLSAHAQPRACPVPPSSLPNVVDGTNAWCPGCVRDALGSLAAVTNEADAFSTGVARTKRSISALIRAEETGRVAPDWAAITRDSGGLTYGAYQFDRKSGSLLAVMRAYVNRSNSPAARGLAPFVRGMQSGNNYDRSATLGALLRMAAKDPVMQEVQEEQFQKLYLDPALAGAAELGLRTPLGTAIYADLKTNGGLVDVVSAAKRRVGPIRNAADEARFIKAMLDAREARFRRLAQQRRFSPYLTGWLRRNDDFRRLAANGDYDLSGRVGIKSKADSFCGGSPRDAQAFRLWMASR